MQGPSSVTTFLFTDIEGSTRLWERDPGRMRPALAWHDAILRSAVEDHRGTVVKMSGDGVHAAFADPLDALAAALQLQLALADPQATAGIVLGVRCGLHAGVDERRDNDYFGSAVNRAARIMSAAHGGQVLLSQAVAALVRGRLPGGTSLRELGLARLRDLADPERIYQLVHPKLRADFPALHTLEATPNNLPQQVTSFVGRERELTEIKLLLGSTRLLTLIGLGGIGKTRLSLQVAADTMDDYPDGVWFVELAPLADARLVPQAVASVLGVKEEAGRAVIEALVKYVRGRRLLVVLDNCEHLVHACAELAKQLLQAGPSVRILASSREHLHVAGEATYPVPTLAVPDPRETLDRAALTRYEAVRLFIDRALAAQPAFQVTDRCATAIADICARVDGIPLAIELAAARVRALSVETIAARLSDRLRLLAGGDRTALPRQQTLRALIDWSYDLLTEPERAMFRRLAVFSGGWTLDAVEAVVPFGVAQVREVVDLLTNLVAKSLVVLDAAGERYRLLDTVREYAQDKLDAAGEGAEARSRHLAFYLMLAETARPALSGPEEAAWLAELDFERENLLSAHAWCDLPEADAKLGLRLVYAASPYLHNRGLLALWHRLASEALARAGAQQRDTARSRALFDAGQACYYMGRYGEAQAYLKDSLAIARAIGDQATVALALQPLGLASQGLGDSVAARGYLEEALALAQELGNKREIAAAMNALAQLHRMEGRLETAERLYATVVSLARELGDRESIAIGLLNLAMASIGRGAGDRAQAMLLEVLAIAAEIGSKPAGQSVLEVSAGLGAQRGQWGQAARFYGAAEAQKRQTGLHRDPADEAFLAPLIAKARHGLGTTAFAVAEAAGHALSYDEAMASAREWLADGSAPRD